MTHSTGDTDVVLGLGMSDLEFEAPGQLLSEISRGLVLLHKRFYGRGPVRAKSYLLDDTLICVLEGGLTVIERTLIDSGQEDAVYELRRSLHAATEDRFNALVESRTRRRVRAHMSQTCIDSNLVVEIFMLERERPRSAHAAHTHEAPAVERPDSPSASDLGALG